jgi:hypothetical protein
MRTWQRRPYVKDLGLVRAAIEEAVEGKRPAELAGLKAR